MLAAMSDESDYTYRYPLRYEGYDTLSYVRTYGDSVLVTVERSTGFRALRRSLSQAEPPVLTVNVAPYLTGMDAFIPEEALHRELDSVFESQRVAKVTFAGSGIRMGVAARQSKRVPVAVRNIECTFASQYGLGGEPVVEPDSVTLYGSAAALEHFSEVPTVGVRLKGVDMSQRMEVPLQPVWEAYSGMCCDCAEVELALPVKRFVERTFVAKVRCGGSDSVRLYPDHVKVHCWVPTELYGEVEADDIEVEARLQEERMVPQVVSFPVGVRIKQVEPAELQYVILRLAVSRKERFR